MKDGSIVIKTKTKFKQAGPGKSEVLGSGGQQVLNARAKTNDELETRASLKITHQKTANTNQGDTFLTKYQDT